MKKKTQKVKSKTVSFRLGLAEKQVITELASKMGVSEAKFLEDIVKPFIKEHSITLDKTKKKENSPFVSLKDLSMGSNLGDNAIELLVKGKLKIKVQLIPYQNWGKNLRNLRPKRWKILKDDTIRKADNKCSICGNTSKTIHCHEDWEIDHQKFTQRLIGLKAICDHCHHCYHWGMMKKIDTNGKLENVITKHYLKINNCTKDELNNHLKEAFDTFNNNSDQEYKLDLGAYDSELWELATEL